MNYNLLAAIIAILMAAFSVISLVVQGHRWRRALQTDHTFRLIEKFYSPEMRDIRRLAARKILNNEISNYEDVYQLLDFFILIGTLIKKKALSLDLIYTLFEYWIVRYWYVTKPKIEELRRVHHDKDLCMTFEKLAGILENHRKQRGIKPISEKEAGLFLQAEAKE